MREPKRASWAEVEGLLLEKSEATADAEGTTPDEVLADLEHRFVEDAGWSLRDPSPCCRKSVARHMAESMDKALDVALQASNPIQGFAESMEVREAFIRWVKGLTNIPRDAFIDPETDEVDEEAYNAFTANTADEPTDYEGHAYG